MKKEIINNISFSIATIILNAFGGLDIWLGSLLFSMVIDIIVGLIKSFLCKSDKSKDGGLSSKCMFHGGIKKILILMLVGIATALDTIISPNNTYIRTAVTGYYIGNEILSILENIGVCGIPLPKIFYKIIDSLKKDAND